MGKKSYFILLIFIITFTVISGELPVQNTDIDTAEVESAITDSFIFRLVTMLGFGGFCGFVTGFALKKIARIFAVILGVIFIVIQFFAFQGWITVDWDAISKSTDIFSGEGMSAFLRHGLKVLTTNLPFGSSFLIGLIMGFKKR